MTALYLILIEFLMIQFSKNYNVQMKKHMILIELFLKDIELILKISYILFFLDLKSKNIEIFYMLILSYLYLYLEII